MSKPVIRAHVTLVGVVAWHLASDVAGGRDGTDGVTPSAAERG